MFRNIDHHNVVTYGLFLIAVAIVLPLYVFLDMYLTNKHFLRYTNVKVLFRKSNF
jgi:hypothetical protein